MAEVQEEKFNTKLRILSEEEMEFLKRMNSEANALFTQLTLMGKVADPRALAVAKTKLQEAVMWGREAIEVGIN